MKPIVIIGTGLAGYSVASEYRKLDAAREIVLISSDDGQQYAKPLLSNALAQNKRVEQLASARAEDMGQRLNASVLTGQSVHGIDAKGGRVLSANGAFEYGELVLALGADPLLPPLRGDGVEDVLTVNDLAGYARLRAVLDGASRVLIMGAGLIGCEFANDLLHGGIVPVVVDPNPVPLASLTPPAIGQGLGQALETAGVCWRLNNRVERVDRQGKGYAVTLLSGEVIEVDAVISAIGLKPRTELAKAAGIVTHRGILIDGYGQTCVPGIYALGDCAEYADGRLLPFVRPTLIAARSIAATLAGALTRIDFPAMPVMVKTPAHPVVVLPPRASVAGTWQAHPEDDGQRWLFKDSDQRLQGFALSGAATKTHANLTRLIGDPLPL